ncbi:outer membrane protease [Pseudochrobactrum saccharolyticum]|uniref:Outer membrane protease n=1 Tax=Pseudochrobactrum saccharolyticum TaxID=354352 RepID=A0A7W8AL21_9HYPH|nr:omptin family outer membrane protease [Pseudochrobactrum saccharolyticum]MBB5092255.1 outer membrane protease [Pseudochrobactrum saccharolyticum]
MKSVSAVICSQFLLIAALPAGAADLNPTQVTEIRISNPDFSFLGGIGYIHLQGDELVYNNTGKKISHLIWKTDAPVLTATAKAVFDNDWTLAGNVMVGFSGNNRMKDYDWLMDPPAGYGSDAWSHRSIHPDTQLNRYITADLALGHDFRLNETALLNLHGGFKYTNVKWDAYGGSYIYSRNEFRDDAGDIPDGERTISYEQSYPTAFLGLEASKSFEQWTFSVQARGGLAFKSRDEDHHWRRNLRFTEKYDGLAFMSVGARTEYAYTAQTSFFLAGNYERYFNKTADTTMYNLTSGEVVEYFPDGAGMKFQSFSLSGGLKYRF